MNNINLILEGLHSDREVSEASRIEVINQNKARYEFVENNYKSICKTAYEKDLARNIILRWVKGKNWEGGLGNGKDIDKLIEKLAEIYDKSPEVVCDDIDTQIKAWEDVFDKKNL